MQLEREKGDNTKGRGENRYHAWNGRLGFRPWFGLAGVLLLEPAGILCGLECGCGVGGN